MRYGYYLASLDEEHGDPKLSADCRLRWSELRLPVAGRYDGVSAWTDVDALHVRVLVQDFSSDRLKVDQRTLRLDLP